MRAESWVIGDDDEESRAQTHIASMSLAEDVVLL